MQLQSFTFNDFQENTYVLYDDSKECIIIDPGCSTDAERNELSNFIDQNDLKPVKLVNTHCHIDHVLGNRFIADKYKLALYAHELEVPLLAGVSSYGQMFGLVVPESPKISHFLNEGDELSFGNTALGILFTPGHSPGSLSFYHETSKNLIAGDVLFFQSIGRTDLPGGDYATLEKSIKEKLYNLPNDVQVFSGHGPSTSIGYEKQNNSFVRAE